MIGMSIITIIEIWEETFSGSCLCNILTHNIIKRRDIVMQVKAFVSQTERACLPEETLTG